jgi:hypothetical protein
MGINIDDLLLKVPAKAKEEVDRAKKRFNSMLRDAVRQETGLLLNRSSAEKNYPEGLGDNISVPVKILPGYPDSVQNVDFDEKVLWLLLILSKYTSAIKQFNDSSKAYESLFEELRKDSRSLPILKDRDKSYPHLKELFLELSQFMNTVDPVKKILSVNEDILGVYRYNIINNHTLDIDARDCSNATIELYWGIIGLVARLLNISTESLTVVVLAHELGHAYTHLGSDIDNTRWGSVGFSSSDHELREGLAQYYTCLICKKIGSKVPDVWKAYLELLARQPTAYHTHEPWLLSYSPEEVRFAMLESRRNGKGTIKVFNEALAAAKAKLRRQN